MKLWILTVVCSLVPLIEGHGRLAAPPGRSTAWRAGFNTPANYNDNQLFCGGFSNQWGTHGGKCGLCGDPWQGPRENEAGGKYATGTVVGSYPAGSVLPVTVQITAFHQGYNQFRLCEHNDPAQNFTQECLDKHLLKDSVTGETDHQMSSGAQNYTYRLQLPAGVACTHCVLQWKYNTGNSWGTNPDTGDSCIGCGPQEQFYGCADIAIGQDGNGDGDGGNNEPATTSTTRPGTTTTRRPATTTTAAADSTTPSTPRPTTPTTSTTPRPSTTPTSRPQSTTTARATTTVGNSDGPNCVPTELYEDTPNMDEWCEVNCAAGYCPSTHCVCTNQVAKNCKPLSPWDAIPGMADWCQKTCQKPLPVCKNICDCQ